MKVWIVYDYGDFLGVFSTEENAEKYKSRLESDSSRPITLYRIETTEVDKEL